MYYSPHILTQMESDIYGAYDAALTIRNEVRRRAGVLYSGNLSSDGIVTLDSLATYEMVIDVIFIQTFCDDSATQNVSTLWLDATAGAGSDIDITFIANDADEFQQQNLVFPRGFFLDEDGDLKLTFSATGATNPKCEYMIYGTVS